MSEISRRKALVTGAVVAAGLVAGSASAAPAITGKKRSLRLAHITDVHVQPEHAAGEGLAACLRHIHQLADAPSLILNGGDCVMDACAADAARAREQAELWKSVLNSECKIPIEHCIGNHDLWGLDLVSSKTTGREPNWGKAWALALYGLKERYRTFERNGWLFIILDSTFLEPRGYTARLDTEQFAWLRKTLEATPKNTPVILLSHIPIVAAAAFFDGENEKTGDWVVPGAWMHIDAREIKRLLSAHSNVKLCLSGHLHLVDRVDYAGITFLCNGAVCAGWWKGPREECHEGYGLLDLYEDGTFDHKYVEYGWKAS